MTAIFGVWGGSGARSLREDAESLAKSLASYSMELDWWQSDDVILGARLLRTTPESLTETLPFVDQNSGMVIVADARLDNRSELLAALNISDRLMPDSQLILKAYQCWGEGAPEWLLGDFAFAIWDPQQQELFCVRDQMGAKSIAYIEKGGRFAFASDSRSLACLPWVGGQLNDDMVVQWFVPEHLGRERNQTWYKDVKALLPRAPL